MDRYATPNVNSILIPQSRLGTLNEFYNVPSHHSRFWKIVWLDRKSYVLSVQLNPTRSLFIVLVEIHPIQSSIEITA